MKFHSTQEKLLKEYPLIESGILPLFLCPLKNPLWFNPQKQQKLKPFQEFRNRHIKSLCQSAK